MAELAREGVSSPLNAHRAGWYPELSVGHRITLARGWLCFKGGDGILESETAHAHTHVDAKSPTSVKKTQHIDLDMITGRQHCI